jgi:trk system potassium uptake protein TrkA
MVGDVVTIIGPSSIVATERERLSPKSHHRTQRVTIFGGGETTIALIKLLLPGRFNLRVIEQDLGQCRRLTEQFPDITVIHGSATSVDLQREEQVGLVDYFVACTNCDEDNIMSALQASNLGAIYAMFVIHKGDYDSVLENIGYKLGIRKFVSPRIATYLELQPYLTGKKCWEISTFNDGSGCFMQLEVSASSPCIGKLLREIPWPPGVVVVALCHDFETKVPAADDIIVAGDHMIVVLPTENRSSLESLFCECA